MYVHCTLHNTYKSIFLISLDAQESKVDYLLYVTHITLLPQKVTFILDTL